ncbi:MAG: PQQ-dependent sugar dehydrogenase [Actinobacteria bacterium]|nr:PQQ-dependent sugar dehydrogenase [Actinomycetota bacterium]
MRTRLTLFAALLGALVVAASATARSSATLPVVVSGLSAPLYVTGAPGEPANRLYVVEQAGRILVVENGRVRPEPFLDLRGRITSGGEQGLLGLAFFPDYATSKLFVVNYTNAQGHTRVVRYRSDGRKALPGSARTLLAVAQPYGNHNGGMVAFGPDQLLYVGLGDGGSGGDPENRSQDMNTLLGKMVRLDACRPGSAPKIVALGLRNPWRYSFDRQSGDLWIGDVGQGAIEEISRFKAGTTDLVNFGWDVYEGRSVFEEKPLGPGRLVQPVAQYSHSAGCSVTGGYVVRQGGPARLLGRYVYGDYCSGIVWSFPASAAAPTPRREAFTVPNLTSFGEDTVGRLYAVSGNGRVYRVR